MEVVHPICCGIDVHKAVLECCLRTAKGTGEVSKEKQSVNTDMKSLKQFSQGLREHNCKVVAMESTGVYWKPVYHVLVSHGIEVIVGNSRDMKRRPGSKTDKLDADWISELLAHGLIQPSFVPPPEIMALRDLTRLRVTLVQSRAQAKNRIHKVLEDANIKLSCVATDIFGVSGRAILDALCQGERDPNVLADLSRRRLRCKIPQLELALEGSFTEHHAGIIQLMLQQIDLLDTQIADVDARIAELTKPYEAEIEQLVSIPGVNQTAAAQIIGEIGVEVNRFGSSGRLSSWAGICPGNNESAGKRKSGKIRKGNRYLKRILNQCAWATSKTETFLGRTFRRKRPVLGGKKTAVAIGHKILVIVYHLFSEGTFYDEKRYDQPSPKEEQRRTRKAVEALEHLGYKVSLEKRAA